MNFFRVLIIAFLVCLAPGIAGAVDTPRAYFSVTDKGGALVEGATVKIGGEKKTCTTDKHGYCSIDFETAYEMRNKSAFAYKDGKESPLALIANNMTTFLTIE